MPKLKPCGRVACGALVRPRERYCADHAYLLKQWNTKPIEQHMRDESGKIYHKPRWKKLRHAVMNRDKWVCQECRKQGRWTTAHAVDHITPLAEGGSEWDTENLQALCRSCHARKTAREGNRAKAAKG